MLFINITETADGREPRTDGLRRLLSLPANVIAHSLVVLGYPAEHPSAESRFQASRIHRNGW